MNTQKKSIPKILWSVTITTAMVAGTGWLQPLGAQAARVQFNPPGKTAPNNTSSGATRGTVRFLPPGEIAPNNTSSGATRGKVQFLPPGEIAPNNTSSGATRGDTNFQPPGDSAPSNTVSGGTRGDDNELPSALVPAESNYGRTIAARPTLLVYVPPTASKEAFFSVQDANRNHHYQTVLPIPSNGGIVSIALPADAPELELGKDYQWFFVTLEPGGTLEPDSYGVNGWIERVETPMESNLGNSSLTPVEQAAEYAAQGIWYDTASLLASAKLARPNDETLAAEWQDLLKQVGLEQLASKPVAQPL